MTPRVEQIVDAMRQVLEKWTEVSAVAVNSYGEDRYDPYFALSLDVYTSRQIRSSSSREASFGEVGAFESSLLTHKDRFLVDDVPVRLEYKGSTRFDQVVTAALAGECRLRDSGTYAFRRVVDGVLVFDREGWFQGMRDSLVDLPEGFWNQLRRSQEATVEHLYADLGASAMREDPAFFLISAGRFLMQLCALLFTINQTFEPSPRTLSEEVLTLSRLPDSFPANLEGFVSDSDDFSLAQRAELAQLMVTSVLSLR
jgi:hypothetical protein